jgi:probable rRNA maturation factor
MITYEVMGKLPPAITPRLLPRIARECSRLRAKTKSDSWQVGLRFVSSSKIQELNRVYRGENCPTDVLSFNVNEGDPSFPKHASEHELGDIAIAPTVARKGAKERAIDLSEELVRLITHGTLHLLGYDHTDSRKEERMFSIQEGIVERVVK